jgi:hypothetical protein
VDTRPNLPADPLAEAREAKPYFLLLLEETEAILAEVRELARKSEQQMRTLLRVDPPSSGPEGPNRPPNAGSLDSSESSN